MNWGVRLGMVVLIGISIEVLEGRKLTFYWGTASLPPTSSLVSRSYYGYQGTIHVSPEQLIPQQQQSQQLSEVSVFAEAIQSMKQKNQCGVRGDRQGSYSCAGSSSYLCDYSSMMELRNGLLGSCISGVFSYRGESQCSCCDMVDNFIDRYSLNMFLQCACSYDLYCREIGQSLMQMLSPLQQFKKCGMRISAMPNC